MRGEDRIAAAQRRKKAQEVLKDRDLATVNAETFARSFGVAEIEVPPMMAAERRRRIRA